MSWRGPCALTPRLADDLWFPRYDIDEEALLEAEEADLLFAMRLVRKAGAEPYIGFRGKRPGQEEERDVVDEADNNDDSHTEDDDDDDGGGDEVEEEEDDNDDDDMDADGDGRGNGSSDNSVSSIGSDMSYASSTL